ncbi:hypothetical protein PENSPDRAFT_568280 [Peniophora sp. CONT]|nr:hypothetical protein PENSPDRAFT_568280 [Peniophora sp. CONT]
MSPPPTIALPSPPSAIPMRYYAIFGIIEPLLTFGGFIGALLDPVETHNQQEPSYPGRALPTKLSTASLVTVTQLAHTCALLGLVNLFVLRALRKHLASQPALQEKIAKALLTPLLIGDIMHLYLTFYALGEERWNYRHYTPTIWAVIGFGVALLVPRAMWHLGVGRYVDARDGRRASGALVNVLKT